MQENVTLGTDSLPTVTAAARRLKVSTATVYSRCEGGAIAAARKRRAVVDLARLLDATKAGGDMTDEEAAELAADAKCEVRSRRW